MGKRKKMDRYIKKVLMPLLIISLIIGSVMPIYATTEFELEAKKLKDMGLFKGSELGFELNRAPSRVEAGVMLIRLLGKEEEAMQNANSHPFNDVPSWANSYVGYLYANGLTKGVSKSQFGSQDLIDSKSYVTFVLRALGYNDEAGDFSWSLAINKALEIGLISTEESAALTNATFLRGHMVDVSYNALYTKLKNSENVLIEKFAQEKTVTRISYQAKASEPPIWHFKIDKDTLPESMKNYSYFSMGGGYKVDLNDVGVYSKTLILHFQEMILSSGESETRDIGIYRGNRHDLILLDEKKEPVGYTQFEYPDPNKTELYVSFKEYTRPELPYEISGALTITDNTLVSINSNLLPEYKYAVAVEGPHVNPEFETRESSVFQIYARLKNKKYYSSDMHIGTNKTFDLKDSGRKGFYEGVCVFFFDENNRAVAYTTTEENRVFEWEY